MMSFQDEACKSFSKEDLQGYFIEDIWERPAGGGGQTRVYTNGDIFESLGINFSHVKGENLPPSATSHRPELIGATFEAMGVSIVSHPKNPYVPTAHCNIRLFVALKRNQEPTWWFGGGFDLTPYYGFEEDAIHFHKMAYEACKVQKVNRYQDFKKWADDYFFLKHRNEARGIGGIFFDDYNTGDFDKDFEFLQSVGNNFIKSYQPLVAKRKNIKFTNAERNFQLYRRGRYVEFNLIYDRGTLFGLQSGGRTESILMSLPKTVRWEYNWSPEPGSPEAKLYTDFLKPKNWLSLGT